MHSLKQEGGRQPILLTGSHRSGTTWAGRIISSSQEVGYIMEPFNDVNRRPGVFGGRFGRFFPCLDVSEQENFDTFFDDTFHFRFRLPAALANAKGPREHARIVRDFCMFQYFQVMVKRPFIKDPNALFLAEWLHERFGTNTVVMIRHPAAFVSSLIKLNWTFPFNDFLNQKALMRDYLSEYEDEISSFALKSRPLIDQAILLWNALHHVIAGYRQRHSDWLFVRHEDMSRDAQNEFEAIFAYLELDYTEHIRALVSEYCDSDNPNDMTSRDIPVSSSKSIKRNSRANIFNWKKRLSSEDISYIRERTEPVASQFYSDADW